MKYGLGIRLLIAFIAGGLAVIYKMKINPRYKQSEMNIVVKAPRRFTFDTLTDPKNVPKYFSWISHLEESKFDKRNISLGKRYYGIVNLPFLGQHDVKYVVTELKDFNWLTLRPSDPKTSWFNTEITLTFSAITKETTHFGVKIAYHRTSALFQITLGRYLRYITDQQLERLGIAAKNLIKLKWEKFRFPNGRKSSQKSMPLSPPPESSSSTPMEFRNKIPRQSQGQGQRGEGVGFSEKVDNNNNESSEVNSNKDEL